MSKGTETRDRILASALRVASVEGLEGITIGRLADAVGLSKSGLFAHFKSKEELQLAVLNAASEVFGEVVFKPALAAPRGEPRVRAFFEHWLEWEAHVAVLPQAPSSQSARLVVGHPAAARNDSPASR